jgi:hypothetical protein
VTVDIRTDTPGALVKHLKKEGDKLSDQIVAVVLPAHNFSGKAHGGGIIVHQHEEEDRMCNRLVSAGYLYRDDGQD